MVGGTWTETQSCKGAGAGGVGVWAVGPAQMLLGSWVGRGRTPENGDASPLSNPLCSSPLSTPGLGSATPPPS